MADFEPPSSPPNADASAEDTLRWYKRQYEQLEHELSEFRQSSGELEKELEKDLDAAEQRENTLRERAENLGFEVDEWKRKCKESKAEANAAQNALEKEVTTLRDANRTMQLKLRDIEVANDDFERQARTTTSSLEDMETKYNSTIERGVMLDEEIKIGEQEREQLRIEAQRLREELSDLKIEAEILQDKLKKQENRHLSMISTELSVPETPSFDRSPDSTASSPLISTPPDVSMMSEKAAVLASDPPSPPMSDASVPMRKATAPALLKTPGPSVQKKSRLPSASNSITPKPKFAAPSATKPTAGVRSTTTGAAKTTTSSRLSMAGRTPMPKRAPPSKLPPSQSLSHIRTLTAQMARLEARVQNARSKLPAPISTPPRASPRGSVMNSGNVTIRSRRRIGGSAASSTIDVDESTPTNNKAFNSSISSTADRTVKHVPRLSTSGVSRLSFGLTPNRGPTESGSEYSRPSSRASASSYARPASRNDLRTAARPASRNDLRAAAVSARPTSRADSRAGALGEMVPPPRPMSRASLGGARTPLGRPVSRTSFGPGHVLHSHSQSMSGYSMAEQDETPAVEKTPSRRGTYSKYEMEAVLGTPSAIPMPTSRRQSMEPGALHRRQSMANLPDLEETY